MVIWGPKDCGKSAGLRRSMVAWRAQERRPSSRVIRLEMKGFTGGYSKFVEMLQKQIFDYLNTIALTYQDIYVLQTCLDRSNHLLPSPINDTLADVLRFLGLDEAATSREKQTGVWLRRWRQYVLSFFNSPEHIATVDFPQLLALLHMVTALHPEAGTILILSEILSLHKLGTDGQTLLHTIITTLETRKSLGSLVPVILETSDGLWASDNFFAPSVRSSRAAFWGFFVHSFSKEEGHQALVEDNQVLSEEDYNIAWDALGGHAGSWSTVSTFI